MHFYFFYFYSLVDNKYITFLTRSTNYSITKIDFHSILSHTKD